MFTAMFVPSRILDLKPALLAAALAVPASDRRIVLLRAEPAFPRLLARLVLMTGLASDYAFGQFCFTPLTRPGPYPVRDFDGWIDVINFQVFPGAAVHTRPVSC